MPCELDYDIVVLYQMSLILSRVIILFANAWRNVKSIHVFSEFSIISFKFFDWFIQIQACRFIEALWVTFI